MKLVYIRVPKTKLNRILSGEVTKYVQAANGYWNWKFYPLLYRGPRAVGVRFLSGRDSFDFEVAGVYRRFYSKLRRAYWVILLGEKVIGLRVRRDGRCFAWRRMDRRGDSYS